MAEQSIHAESVQYLESDSVTERVIDTIAEAEGVEPVELDPLYTTIDPDVLDSLFHSQQDSSSEPSAPSAEIRFEYQGYAVRVTAGGQVSVDEVQG